VIVAPKEGVTSNVERTAAIRVGGSISLRRSMTLERALSSVRPCDLSATCYPNNSFKEIVCPNGNRIDLMFVVNIHQLSNQLPLPSFVSTIWLLLDSFQLQQVRFSVAISTV